MAFKMIKVNDDQTRIEGHKGNLIGLITRVKHVPEDQFRVELLMKIEGTCSTYGGAIAYVRGAEAALYAFNAIPGSVDERAKDLGVFRGADKVKE